MACSIWERAYRRDKGFEGRPGRGYWTSRVWRGALQVDGASSGPTRPAAPGRSFAVDGPEIEIRRPMPEVDAFGLSTAIAILRGTRILGAGDQDDC
jgi:hypothetical protein